MYPIEYKGDYMEDYFKDWFGILIKKGDRVLYISGNRNLKVEKYYVHSFTKYKVRLVERVGDKFQWPMCEPQRLIVINGL